MADQAPDPTTIGADAIAGLTIDEAEPHIAASTDRYWLDTVALDSRKGIRSLVDERVAELAKAEREANPLVSYDVEREAFAIGEPTAAVAEGAANTRIVTGFCADCVASAERIESLEAEVARLLPYEANFKRRHG